MINCARCLLDGDCNCKAQSDSCIMKLREALDGNDDKMNELQKDISEASSALEACNNECSKLNELLKAREEDCANKDTEIAQIRDYSSKLSDEFVALGTENDTLHAALEDQAAESQGRIAELETSLQECTKECANRDAHITGMQSWVEEVSKDNQTLKAQVDTLIKVLFKVSSK